MNDEEFQEYLTKLSFQEYLEKFELTVVIKGAQTGKLGKEEMIPTRNGRLSRTDFGKLIGNDLEAEFPIAIDYYGHIKKTAGFHKMVEDMSRGVQIRMVKCMIVHFASVKIEDIVKLAPKLVAGFPVFKQTILKKRGFKK